jgi:hypothetical protein
MVSGYTLVYHPNGDVGVVIESPDGERDWLIYSPPSTFGLRIGSDGASACTGRTGNVLFGTPKCSLSPILSRFNGCRLRGAEGERAGS